MKRTGMHKPDMSNQSFLKIIFLAIAFLLLKFKMSNFPLSSNTMAAEQS